MRRLLSKYGARWALGLFLTLIAGAQSVGVFPTTLVDRGDLFIYDMRMRAQPGAIDPRVVVVDIDEKSLTEIGRWPWSRDVVARLVTQMTDYYRVKSVGFDVVFAEPDTTSGYATLEALASTDLKDIPQFGKKIRALKPSLDFDGIFAKALKGRPVVLGINLSNNQKKGLLPPPAFSAGDLDGRDLDAESWKEYEGNLPELQRAARAGGFINNVPDPDGSFRSYLLLARVGSDYYESLALATVRVALGASAVKPEFLKLQGMSDKSRREYGFLDSVMLNTEPRATRIPVEPHISMHVQFRGEGGPGGGGFRYISAADVVKGRLPQADLADRIVLVGTTAPGLKDLRSTPVNGGYPGVEMHANVIASILDGTYKQKPDFSAGVDIVQIVLVGILLALALPALTPLTSILFAVGAGVAVAAFNFWMYQSLGLVLPVAATLMLITGLFVANIAWGYLFEHRKGRAIVNLFGSYVAPELVAEMAANPESYNMEGDSRELTVLFADVRGFTTISEGLEPNALREYINLYLTAMSEDIQGNRGTLDKYIGDAVMAFWGAPVAVPNHASLAVTTALQMQASAHKLNRDFVARGWPPLKIGVGLNTGQMRVGDMGSKIRRAYTVMGDAVNLASRVEGITKVYGAGVVVGEATRLAAPEFAYRELDRVKVKGKNEPISIFEPIALDAELDAAQHDALARWHAALAQFRAQDWSAAEQAIAALSEAYPDDGLYRLYAENIAYFRQHPPGADWDGVTTYATKKAE